MRVIFHAGVFLAGSAAVYAVVIACGGGSSADPIGSADAQNCGDCTGIVRTVSADGDPAQALGGTGVAEPNGLLIEVATGPFYLTDFVADDTLKLGTAPAGQACFGFVAFKLTNSSQNGAGDSIHGARFLIGANETLCIDKPAGTTNAVTFRWAGFRPY